MADPFPTPFGRYQLTERLAVGGMAELFLASVAGEHGFAKTVVIKRLLPHLAPEAAYNAMFIDEAKLTARLVHPKIAQTYELGRVNDSLFIAMEFVDGIDVLAMLRELAYRRQRVPVEVAVWVAHEVLDALDFAHHLHDENGNPLGVVHRDISPSNVLLSRRGDVKLVDFGIARAAQPGRAHQTKSGTLKGKYGYMSPEQVVEQPVDARSDLFSVGIVLAEMLCGRRLFAAANELDVLLMVRDAKLSRLDKFGADLESHLDEILRRALKKNVDERWPSAAAFRDALGEWLFEQRFRVTPRNVADVVESLQEAASDRRRESLNAAADAASAVLEQVDVEARALGSARAATPAPAPLPPPPEDRDSAPVISVERNEISGMHTVPTSPGRRAPKEVRRAVEVTPSPLPVAGRAHTVPRKLPTEPTPVQPRPLPAVVARIAPDPPASDPFASDPLADLRLELEAELPGAPAKPSARERSVRYPSIEAAISALSPVAPDPAAKDFDDTDVSSRPREKPVPVANTVPPPVPVLPDIPAPADDSGDFAATPPLTVLSRLMTSRATGLLVCAIGGIRKEIYVRDGMPEFVSSNVASELFGAYLVGQNILSEGELAMALAMMPHYGGKLGDTLVGLGLLKPLEVFRHLTRQVRAKLVDVCTWSKGSFAWYAGRENPREAFPLDLNGFEVLGAGSLALPDETVDGWIMRHRADHLRAVKGGRIGPQRFELDGLRELHERLDGRRPVGDLLDQYAELDRRRTGRLLMLLTQTELARSV